MTLRSLVGTVRKLVCRGSVLLSSGRRRFPGLHEHLNEEEEVGEEASTMPSTKAPRFAAHSLIKAQ